MSRKDINLDKVEELRPKKYRGDWANLPDLILEQIFQYLPYKVRKWRLLPV